MKTLRPLLSLALALLAGPFALADSVPISGLPAISSVTSTTVVPVVDTAGTPTTKKANVSQLISGLPLATTTTVGTMSAADKTLLTNATNSNTASTLVKRDASGNAAFGTLTATTLTGLTAPTNATDAANKGYVDAAAAGLVIKTPAVAATVSANVVLAGGAPNTLDGVTLATNDRVLVKNQTDNKENGIYYVATLGTGSDGTWTRTTDADTGAELVTGSYVFISGGTANANAAYTMVTTGTITIGTSPIVWNLFSQVTQIQASNILGQLVGSQVQDGAINTAKLASGITPVEILSALPSVGNFPGRTVYNTSDAKLYKYNGSTFTASVASTDIAGQITNTQIADNSISTPKLQANSVTGSNIAAGTITAGNIASDTITAGEIAAGAINTSELAAGAVNASKIAANTITAGQIAANTITAGQIASGTITADRLNVSNLSSISANIGTITAGTISGVQVSTSGTYGSAQMGTNGRVQVTDPNVFVYMQAYDPGTGSEGHVTLGRSSITQVDLKSYVTGGSVDVKNSSGSSTVTLTGASGTVAATTVNAANVNPTALTVNGTNAVGRIYFDTTVQTFSTPATEQSFTITVASYCRAGFLQCSSDGDLLGRYWFDGSSSSSAIFKVRRLDGSSFSGTYRFSYLIIN